MKARCPTKHLDRKKGYCYLMNHRKGSDEAVSKTTIPNEFISRLPIASAFFLLFIALGCAGPGSGLDDRTSRDWYEDGMRLMQKKRYQGAAESFREAGALYRDAALDADIQMALGDAYFRDGKYDEAVETYREFLRVHPRNRLSDRAQFQVGMCYFMQMRGEDRSQEPTQNALDAFNKVVRNYPRSEMAAEAREKIVLCRRRLAKHELYVGRYYLRTKSYSAALPRFDRVYQEYRDLGYGDDALYYLGLCYRKLEQSGKAQEVWDLLIRDYPHSRYRKEISDREG
jgi:outer membrane protein assembly factor BamD